MMHNFHDSLELSRQHENAPWWIPVYREAFPNLESAVSVRSDGWAQRAGIDRVLTLGCGKTIQIDEKVRAEDWPDILLEGWSCKEKGRRGWIAKPMACDFLAYAFIPSRTCYLLPFQTLQRSWRKNKHEWAVAAKSNEQNGFRIVEAKNKVGNDVYTTVSVAVPIETLMGALADAMKVSWQ